MWSGRDVEDRRGGQEGTYTTGEVVRKGRIRQERWSGRDVGDSRGCQKSNKKDWDKTHLFPFLSVLSILSWPIPLSPFLSFFLFISNILSYSFLTCSLRFYTPSLSKTTHPSINTATQERLSSLLLLSVCPTLSHSIFWVFFVVSYCFSTYAKHQSEILKKECMWKREVFRRKKRRFETAVRSTKVKMRRTHPWITGLSNSMILNIRFALHNDL
jgi:hypothetical protein